MPFYFWDSSIFILNDEFICLFICRQNSDSLFYVRENDWHTPTVYRMKCNISAKQRLWTFSFFKLIMRRSIRNVITQKHISIEVMTALKLHWNVEYLNFVTCSNCQNKMDSIQHTWSSESTVSGMMSGFFSSLSLPSSSRLPMLLSLGPGDPSPVVVPCDNSFRLKRLRRLPPQGNRNTTIIANAPMTRAADSPMTTDSIGVSAIGARGRSIEAFKEEKPNKMKNIY